MRREQYRSRILELLSTQGGVSRADLARRAGLGKPIVSSIVDELVKEGFIRELGFGSASSSGGRRPVLLDIDPKSSFVLGVHVGVRNVSAVAGDAHGNLIAPFATRPTPLGRPQDAIDSIVEACRAAAKAAGVRLRDLKSVGISLPGLVDVANGRCVYAPNLGWRDLEIGPAVSAALGVPVFVHNLAVACAAAEVSAGAIGANADAVFVYLASSIEAAIVKDGKLLHGIGGIAGQLGHCPVAGSADLCACGNVGCLETVAGVPAIARAAMRAMESGRKSSLSKSRMPGGLTATEVADASAARDPLALEIMSAAGTALGISLAWLINLFHPEVVVIGGDLTVVREEMLHAARSAAARHSLPHASFGVPIETSALALDSELSGSVLVALRSLHSRPSTA